MLLVVARSVMVYGMTVPVPQYRTGTSWRRIEEGGSNSRARVLTAPAKTSQGSTLDIPDENALARFDRISLARSARPGPLCGAK